MSNSFLPGALALGMVFFVPVSGPAQASPIAAKVLENLEGLKEGTARANRLMGVNTKRVPWCGHAVKYAVTQAGKKPAAHYAAAKGWEGWGEQVAVSNIKRGDVIVFRSSYSRSGRHVAVATAVEAKRVKVCGGNTRDKVHCGWRPKSSIVTVRR